MVNFSRGVIQTMDNFETFAISKIVHEIRNPLTLINSSLQLIQQLHPEVKDFQFWGQTLEDVNYLGTLLEDLASYNDDSQFFRCEVDVRRLVLSLEESLRPFLLETHKHFSLHLPSQLPSLFGSPVKLKQALLNILKNACEATSDNGCITMSVRKYLSDIILIISDDGCGMSGEYLSSLFKPFISHKSTGSGLGMAITKKIIDAHHGQIEVVSALGKGTTFTITLPHMNILV